MAILEAKLDTGLRLYIFREMEETGEITRIAESGENLAAKINQAINGWASFVENFNQSRFRAYASANEIAADFAQADQFTEEFPVYELRANSYFNRLKERGFKIKTEKDAWIVEGKVKDIAYPIIKISMVHEQDTIRPPNPLARSEHPYTPFPEQQPTKIVVEPEHYHPHPDAPQGPTPSAWRSATLTSQVP